jgi:ferredoxin
VRAIVDLDRCEGNARCVAVAPELFALGDDDQARVLMTDVPPELREKADAAVRLCPRQAIAVDEGASR